MSITGKYKIVTKESVHTLDPDDDGAMDRLVKEQNKILKRLGYDLYDKPYVIHNFDLSYLFVASIQDAIDGLAIKDGADLVQYENGNYGFIAYYNSYINGFEILREPTSKDWGNEVGLNHRITSDKKKSKGGFFKRLFKKNLS